MPSKKSVTISSVGTTYVEGIVTGLPDKFLITKVTGRIKSGAGTTVAVRIAERSNPELEYVVAEYPLASEIEEQENLVVYSYKARDTDQGKIYVSARVNSGANSVVVVTIDYTLGVPASSGGSGGGGETYSVFTESEDGLVPAPGGSSGDFLRDDGTWATPGGSVGADLTAIEALGGMGFAARTAANTWALREILGTSDRITVTDGTGQAGEPTIDIAATYAGQATITTLGTITTGTWDATTIGISKGGTGQTTATAAFDALAPTTTLGDLIYHDGTDNVRLAGSTAAAKRFLTQTGNGAVSAAPAWGSIASSDLPSTADMNARVNIKKAGVSVGTRRSVNLIEGSNITLTVTDDSGSEEVDVTIAAAGSSLADADYGDITVSASGTNWTIDNDVVTYAKLQNISATQRVLGRNSSGAGDAEEVTAPQVLEWIGGTQGQILYRNATTWTVLSPGTDGDVLTTHGAGQDPTWETPSGGGGSGLDHGAVMSRIAIGF